MQPVLWLRVNLLRARRAGEIGRAQGDSGIARLGPLRPYAILK